MSDLFGAVLAAGPVADATSDRAWTQAMLDFEAALAAASAAVGVIPSAAVADIESCCRADIYDLEAISTEAVGIGNPAGPLVRALTSQVPSDSAAYVHLGATSQDVVDTATMLVTARALDALDAELRTCGDLLAWFAGDHTNTVMAGRSFLQQAPPVTFGLTAAGWLSGITSARNRLTTIRRRRLAVQFGGAVGTLAALGDKGVPVLVGLACRLGLAEPVLPWHTERSRIAEVAGALGETCGAVAKIARDITLLAQTEVSEVWEQGPPGSGGSSTMPHKRNPVAALLAAGSAGQAPGLVSALLSAETHEHQRAAGAWHAEWRPYRELLRATGSAVHWLRIGLERLQVDPERMRANLQLTGGMLLAESVAIELFSVSGTELGRQAATDAVADCCRAAQSGDCSLADLLAADPVIGTFLDRNRIDELLDPNNYLGATACFIERALAEWQKGPQ